MTDRAPVDREATDRISPEPDRTTELGDGSTVRITKDVVPPQSAASTPERPAASTPPQPTLPQPAGSPSPQPASPQPASAQPAAFAPPPAYPAIRWPQSAAPAPMPEHPQAGWRPPQGPPMSSWPQGYPAPQPVNPPLPKAGSRHTGFIIFGVLAALILTGGAWALIMLAGGNSPFGSGAADEPQAGPPPATGAPFPAPTAPPSAGAPTDPDASTGPTGQVRVTWTVLQTVYTATLTTDGPTGTAEVSYADPSEGGKPTLIRQDLTFVSSGDRLAYVGSNPRDAATDVATGGYLPDIFVLSSNDEGSVFIEQVCDDSGICAPATML